MGKHDQIVLFIAALALNHQNHVRALLAIIPVVDQADLFQSQTGADQQVDDRKIPFSNVT